MKEKIPNGKCCEDCVWLKRCKELHSDVIRLNSTECNYTPSRFVEKVKTN